MLHATDRADEADNLPGELGSREALRRLARFFVPLRGIVAIGIILTLGWSGVNVYYGSLAKAFLDAIDRNAGTHHLSALNFFTLVALLVFTGRAALYVAMNYTWNLAAQRLSLRMRNDVFAHLQSLSFGFYDRHKTGQLMSCLNNDILTVSTVLGALQDTVGAPITLVGGIAVLFWLNWPLALVSCVCLPLIASIIVRAARRMRSCTAEVQASYAQVLDVAQETLSGVRMVKSFGNEAFEIERFDRRSMSVFRNLLHTIWVRAVMASSVEWLGTVAIILVLWIGGWQIVSGARHLTFGDLTWFVLVLRIVAGAARDCGGISVSIAAVSAAADRVFTLLDVSPEIQEKPEALELSRVAGRVQFRHVSFAYRAGIPVLDDINFTMEPGEAVALVGPTGSGKTTVAALIPRFYDVASGAISVDGVDVRDCTLASLRAQIGIVPQDTLLFAATVAENIAYGRLGASREEIERAAHLANAWEFIERLPEGLETKVGERGITLSGGQRQRIAIARAILRNPRILILDEATSALDTQSEALVQDALQRLVATRTTLVIAHRLSTIRQADRILVLKEGRVVESGRHEDLLARGGVYSELYRTQFRWEEGSAHAA